MRYLLSILLLVLCPLVGRAATIGTVYGAEVETNGWVLKVYVYGVDTNGTFAFGFGDYNSLNGTQKIALTLTSQGFDDTGTPTTLQRTVYGTKQLRRLYPNHTQNDVWTNTVIEGSVIKLALSDWVYSGDSNLTVNMGAGWYTWLGAPSVATNGLSVTNSSTHPYPKVIANWSWPVTYDQVTNADNAADLRVTAFHASAQDGRPVRCVKFWAVDTAGNRSPTNTVTTATIKSDLLDQVPVVEYCTSLKYTNLVTGNYVTNYFAAYPWYGDSSSVLDCSDGVNVPPHYDYAPKVLLWNSNATMGVAHALVDGVNGNDSTGIVYSGTNWNPAVTPYPFLSIGRASSSIQSSNNIWYSRNNAGLGTIWLTNGTHRYREVAPSATINYNLGYLTIRSLNSMMAALTNVSSSGDIGDAVRCYDVVFQPESNSSATWFANMDCIWLDRCLFLDGSVGVMTAANFNPVTNVFLTHSIVTNVQTWSFQRSGTSANTQYALIRGNRMYDYQENVHPWVFVGNYKGGTNSDYKTIFFGMSASSAGGVSKNDGAIVAFNKFMGINVRGTAFDFYDDFITNCSRGLAFVQNVCEAAWWTGSSAELFDSANTNAMGRTNMLFWNNTLTGHKLNMFYEYGEGNTAHVVGCQWLNNWTDDWNHKAEYYTPYNTVGYGTLPTEYGVGWYGTINGENVGAPGEFQNTFAGLYGAQFAAATTNTWPKFINRQSLTVDGNAAGDGNYRIESSSPMLQTFKTRLVLPYDIEGVPRSAIDPPGAYASGNPKKGAMLLGF